MAAVARGALVEAAEVPALPTPGAGAALLTPVAEAEGSSSGLIAADLFQTAWRRGRVAVASGVTFGWRTDSSTVPHGAEVTD